MRDPHQQSQECFHAFLHVCMFTYMCQFMHVYMFRHQTRKQTQFKKTYDDEMKYIVLGERLNTRRLRHAIWVKIRVDNL